MTHQTLSLEKYWKLFSATLTNMVCRLPTSRAQTKLYWSKLEKAYLLINDIIELYISAYNLGDIVDVSIFITVTGSFFFCFSGLIQSWTSSTRAEFIRTNKGINNLALLLNLFHCCLVHCSTMASQLFTVFASQRYDLWRILQYGVLAMLERDCDP